VGWEVRTALQVPNSSLLPAAPRTDGDPLQDVLRSTNLFSNPLAGIGDPLAAAQNGRSHALADGTAGFGGGAGSSGEASSGGGGSFVLGSFTNGETAGAGGASGGGVASAREAAALFSAAMMATPSSNGGTVGTGAATKAGGGHSGGGVKPLDALALTVQFDPAATYQGLESVSPVNIRVVVSAPVPNGQTVKVDYAATGGTASGGGVDYTLANGTLTFNAGDAAKDITIPIVNDPIQEPYETIELTLSNPVNATLGTNTLHIYTIIDDEGGLIKAKTPQVTNYDKVHQAQTLFGRNIPGLSGADVKVGVIEPITSHWERLMRASIWPRRRSS